MSADTPSRKSETATHICTTCHRALPVESFFKHRALQKDQRWARKAAWYCDDCRPPSTPNVRRYRSDPEKRDRDRARSRAWKERNRERNRARDRAYARQKGQA